MATALPLATDTMPAAEAAIRTAIAMRRRQDRLAGRGRCALCGEACLPALTPHIVAPAASHLVARVEALCRNCHALLHRVHPGGPCDPRSLHALGTCTFCGCMAPVEVHHLRGRRAPDAHRHIARTCLNCHARAHAWVPCECARCKPIGGDS